ncbi:MAG: hypothetical protein WB774_01680, partial [Xanthobacteraceae bacterium]
GALAVIRYAKIHGTKHRPWLTALLARRPTMVAAFALARTPTEEAGCRFMCDERTNNSEPSSAPTPPPPRCPSCAQRMKLVRETKRFGVLPSLYTFECRACGLAHTDAS